MNKTRKGLSAFRNADGLLISLIGFILILIFTHHGGIGVSPDSIAYLGVARNIINNGIVADYSLRPLVDFPVFYPFFLSIAGFFVKMDLVTVLPYLNGFLFAGIIIFTGYLIDSFKGVHKLYKWIILVCIALSPSLLEIYSMLWSETLFIFLTIIFIRAFSAYGKKQSITRLLLCAGIAAIACITRYAGVTIIGTGLMLIFFDRSLGWQKKMLHFLLFGFLSSSLLVLNLLHNLSITGSLTGPRQKGILTLSDNVVFYGRVTGDWLPVWSDEAQIVSGLAIAIFIFIVVLFLKRTWFKQGYLNAENCFGAFFVVYTVFIIAISTLSHFEQINNRLLSPLFIPLLIALTSWIPRMLRKLNPLQFNMAVVLLVLFTFAFAGNQLIQDNDLYKEANSHGIPGYTDDTWKDSETARFLRGHGAYFDPEFVLYSNAHEAAYFNGGVRAESIPQIVDQKDIRNFFRQDGLYLIWFDNFSDDELIKFKTIWDQAEVIKLYDFKDGDIFFIKPRHFSLQQQ